MTRLLLLLILLASFGTAQAKDKLPVVVFAGAASQPPLEEAAQTFQTRTGIPVFLNLGGSGAMLNQVLLSGQGDLYIPGSPDYMQKAIEFGLVAEEPATIAYLVPALIVAKGNPLNISSLDDLKSENLRIGLADRDGVCLGIGADDQRTLAQLIEQSLDADIIITTGGVSVGEKDHVQASLQNRNFEKIFWKVAIKPGKPVLFGKVEGIPFFGLPGNPAATVATFELFAKPAIKRLSGHVDVLPKKRIATMTHEVVGGGGTAILSVV